MVKRILEKIIPKRIRQLRCVKFFTRIIFAASHYNSRYTQIIKWGFRSREDTNFTYDISKTNVEYLASTISHVTNTPYKEVMKYLHEPINDKALKNYVIKKIKRSEFSNVADPTCKFGRRLGWYAFARIMKPKVIVETGVDKGHGAVLLCSALLKNKDEGYNGRYYGTDIDPKAGYLLDEKYKKVGSVLYGDSIESLNKLDKKIDLFINDSDHSSSYEYDEYVTVKGKLSTNSIILGDNSHATDKLFQFSIENDRNFIFFHETPKDHWYPGGGIGISFK